MLLPAAKSIAAPPCPSFVIVPEFVKEASLAKPFTVTVDIPPVFVFVKVPLFSTSAPYIFNKVIFSTVEILVFSSNVVFPPSTVIRRLIVSSSPFLYPYVTPLIFVSSLNDNPLESVLFIAPEKLSLV